VFNESQNLYSLKKLFKYLLISLGLIGSGIIVLWLLGMMSFSGVFDKHVSREEAVSNFKKREAGILQFSDYFSSTVPENHEVFISINENRCSLSLGMPGWAVYQQFPTQHFECKLSSVETSSVFLKQLGWDSSIFKNVVQLFKQTNCLSAKTNNGSINLEYRTGTWNSYGYYVSPTPITDSLKRVYDSVGIQILNPRVTISRATAL
jgi:hypothetical protein